MPTFTVHAPPPRPGESAGNPERYIFVRDGFYFWAFALTPLWLLLHRLWLVFAGFLAIFFLVGLGLTLLGVPQWADYAVGLLLALLVGFEAATLWRWTLGRRGYRLLGFTVGDDLEAAEQRFFAAWVTRQHDSPAEPPAKFAAPVWRGPPSPSDVIGLFPEPGGKS